MVRSPDFCVASIPGRVSAGEKRSPLILPVTTLFPAVRADRHVAKWLRRKPSNQMLMLPGLRLSSADKLWCSVLILP